LENNTEIDDIGGNTVMKQENNNRIVNYISIFFPLGILILILSSFAFNSYPVTKERNTGFIESIPNNSNLNPDRINILSEDDITLGIKDTVYTDKECWLELRIDQQMLYQHWRDGKLEKYPISTGNKYLNKGIDSRPGLFAIFFKTEHHQSTQFNNADMYHFMPFNQGIGFHSLDGTGYYGNLGKQPSSHGCIRMRHEDAKKIFKDCPLGTLVLAHRGATDRTVAFAPDGYNNKEELSKDAYKTALAENLYNLLEGNYYLKSKKFFVVDPKIIPVSGIYIGYDRKLPEKQKVPKNDYSFEIPSERSGLRSETLLEKNSITSEKKTVTEKSAEGMESASKNSQVSQETAELIKKYFHNPIGILPYYPPDKR